MSRRAGLLLLAITAVVFSIAGLIAGHYVDLPFLNAAAPISTPTPEAGVSPFTVAHNPVVIDPTSKTVSAVAWKENITKENPYACPEGYKPNAGAMFTGSGTKTNPYYLKTTLTSISRTGNVYSLGKIGPLQMESTNFGDIITLSSDVVATNPRVSSENSNLIIVDLSRFTNTITPKYAYITNSYPFTSYSKESEVIGAPIKKTGYPEDPSWWAICIKYSTAPSSATPSSSATGSGVTL